jgi:hypothetical protein
MMKLTEEQRKAMIAAAKPLIRWLSENCPPQAAVAVNRCSAELFYSVVWVLASVASADEPPVIDAKEQPHAD